MTYFIDWYRLHLGIFLHAAMKKMNVIDCIEIKLVR